MARSIQVLLPLVCVVLAEAHFHLPFFNNFPGLHPPRPILPMSDGPRDNNGGYDQWFQHFGNPDDHQFSSESHEIIPSYENMDPYFNPYYHGNGWTHMPGINHAFNIPNPGYNSHMHQSSHEVNIPQEKPIIQPVHNDGVMVQKPEEIPKEIQLVDKTPTEQTVHNLNNDEIPNMNNKLNEATPSDEKKNPEELPPKINEKDKKDVEVDEKKDYLLIGQDNDPNNVYLLHENNPNPTGVITTNTNQPCNNIAYVPYNPGQANNQVYQLVNGQPATSPTNVPMAQEKIELPNTNNVVSNPVQGTVNVNADTQNPGYVTIYSNGQLIQIPGVVVNQAPNNVPVQNGNQVQGTNYVNANTVPNNVQTVQAVQNPGTNVIYATIPNQATNGPTYVQVPNNQGSAILQNNGMSNYQGGAIPQNNGMSNNQGLPNNVVYYQVNPNTVAQPAVNDGSNGYGQPTYMVPNQSQGTMTVSIPNQSPVFTNQNVQYQPAFQQQVNSGTNGYNQPIVLNLGQGQTAPNQGDVNSQNVPVQTAVQTPVASNNNGYNQPTAVGSERQINPPNQVVMYNQNMPVQTGIQIPITNNGYNENPPVVNPIPTVETRDVVSSNQNVQPQLAVAVDTGSNGYNQPQVVIQGDQGANAVVNTPSGVVVNQGAGVSQPSIVLDSNNLASLGAQPAIMITDFKEKAVDKTDKKKSKDKKEKKDKGKKKDKKVKDDDSKSKEDEQKVDKPKLDQHEIPEPFINQKVE